jgi:hypothetical protein
MSDSLFRTIEHRGHKIEVHFDCDCEAVNPRENDNVGTMVCWHRRANYGDEQPKCSPEDWFRAKLTDWAEARRGISERIDRNIDVFLERIEDWDLHQLMNRFVQNNMLVPIMAYEDGGITIRAYNYGNFPDKQWDCGQLGFIYVSYEDILKNWGGKGKLPGVRAMKSARRCLEAEIEEYNSFLTGEVYGYKMFDPDGNETDSCWGFIGDWEEMVRECKANIDSMYEGEKLVIAQACTHMNVAQFVGL